MLAITGMQFRDLTGTFGHQDVELDKLFMDVAVYNQRVMDAPHVGPVMDLAIRTAIMRRQVSHVTIPIDVQMESLKQGDRSDRNIPHHTSTIPAISGNFPALRGSAAGRGRNQQRKADCDSRGPGRAGRNGRAAGAGRAARPADRQAPAGKGTVPNDSPYTTGGIGLLGTAPSETVLEDCDTLVMVGTSYPYMEYLPKPGDCRCVQIDSNAQRIGLRYPTEVGLVGDSKRTLKELLPLLKRNSSRKFLEARRRT